MEPQLSFSAQTSIGCIPLHDRIYIREEEAETVTKGGIIIPDNVKEKPQLGTIVAIGAGYADRPMTVQVGDLVKYSKYAGSEDEIDGVTYRTMREADIFCILVKKPKPTPTAVNQDATPVESTTDEPVEETPAEYQQRMEAVRKLKKK